MKDIDRGSIFIGSINFVRRLDLADARSRFRISLILSSQFEDFLSFL